MKWDKKQDILGFSGGYDILKFLMMTNVSLDILFNLKNIHTIDRYKSIYFTLPIN